MPVAIILPYLGVVSETPFDNMARLLAMRGVSAAVVTLPWHMTRQPRGVWPLTMYTSSDPDVVIRSFQQALSDTLTVRAWLQRQRWADAGRMGIIGVSLGALIAHTAMGVEPRLSAGVAILGGGGLLDIYTHSALVRLFHPRLRSHFTPYQIQAISALDPLTFATRNRPRRVLMIEAARDLVIPPHDASRLWNALGRPPIIWLDTNHFAPDLAAADLARTAAAYLASVWSGRPDTASQLPPVWAPTLKLGLLFNLDCPVTFAIQWQALALFRRPDHMSLLHADLGWSGRGPFAALGVTVNPSLDIGVAHRFFANDWAPYVSLHLVP